MKIGYGDSNSFCSGGSQPQEQGAMDPDLLGSLQLSYVGLPRVYVRLSINGVLFMSFGKQ